MVIRRHRDDALNMWRAIADASRRKLCDFADVGPDHPAWSMRPYKVFLRTPTKSAARLDTSSSTQKRKDCHKQSFPSVQSYNNWLFHKPLAARST
jgi:hypothetical protein